MAAKDLLEEAEVLGGAGGGVAEGGEVAVIVDEAGWWCVKVSRKAMDQDWNSRWEISRGNDKKGDLSVRSPLAITHSSRSGCDEWGTRIGGGSGIQVSKARPEAPGLVLSKRDTDPLPSMTKGAAAVS